MKALIRTLTGLFLGAIVGLANADFTPQRVYLYGTYAGTNSGFNYLTDVDQTLTASHVFDETASQGGSGGESAVTHRQGHLTGSEAWMQISNSTTVRSSCGGGLSYDFLVTNSHVRLVYDLKLVQLVWWDNVVVQVSDQTSQSLLFNKQTVNESGQVDLDVTPGHKIRLYVGLNQNNLNGFSYPAGSTNFKAEATLTPLIVPTNLDIQSTNPAAGVPITVYTRDINNAGNGTTPFTRVYDSGTSASVNAPATIQSGAKAFNNWTLDGVVQSGRTLTVPMNAAHSLVANYVDAYTLTVTSTNPGSGVPITVYQADVNGQKNGTTTFVRTYKNGASVSLNAPATAGTKSFIRWEKDGVSMGKARTVTVPMGSAHILNAVYVQLYTLSIGSETPNSGVPITVWKPDYSGLKNGTTPFTRSYPEGSSASMTAPATSGGAYFSHWLVDGANWGSAKTLVLGVNSALTVVAVYRPAFTLTVTASGTAAGVPITVWKKDVNGAQNGTTMFTRLFWTGTSVSLTAPALAEGKNFVRWEVDGIPQGAFKTVTVNMTVNRTITAIYQ